MMDEQVRIVAAAWEVHRDVLMGVRVAVFVEEQGVPLELERDPRDAEAFHLLALTPAGYAVGTGRLLPDGQIGRMAVLQGWRGRGIGQRLLEDLIGAARYRRLPRVFLHAQCTAEAFYERAGFRSQGAVFEEAGLPHRLMTRILSAAQ